MYSPSWSCRWKYSGLSHLADPGHLHSSLSSLQYNLGSPEHERTTPCPTQHPVIELNTCALLLHAASIEKQDMPLEHTSPNSNAWFLPPPISARQLLSNLHPGTWDRVCRFLQAGEHLQLRCCTAEHCHAQHPWSILPKGINQLPLLIILPLLARSLLFCGRQAGQLSPLADLPLPSFLTEKNPTTQHSHPPPTPTPRRK